MDLNNPEDFIKHIFMNFSEKRNRNANSLADQSDESPNAYNEWLNDKILEELKLIRQHTIRQYLMSDEEFENNNDVVPFRKFTSSHPEFQWRLDNLKCECGNCHFFSGTKNKRCWVFEQLGCSFSIAVRKFFQFHRSEGVPYTPIF